MPPLTASQDQPLKYFICTILQAFGYSSIVCSFGAQMETQMAPKFAPAGLEIATFAGGCFWGLELAYQRLPGVVKTSVGYTQGQVESPSYNAVCSGRTGHAEAVQVGFFLTDIVPCNIAFERWCCTVTVHYIKAHESQRPLS